MSSVCIFRILSNPLGREIHIGQQPAQREKRAGRGWFFKAKSGIRPANGGIGHAFRRLPLPLIRRFSSAVEQRFCKPKVGSSILSTGTKGDTML